MISRCSCSTCCRRAAYSASEREREIHHPSIIKHHMPSSWSPLVTEDWHDAKGDHCRNKCWYAALSCDWLDHTVKPTNLVAGTRTMHESYHKPVPWYISPNPSSPCAELLCDAGINNFPQAPREESRALFYPCQCHCDVPFCVLLSTAASDTSTARAGINKQCWNQNKIFIRSEACRIICQKKKGYRDYGTTFQACPWREQDLMQIYCHQ